MNLFPSTFAMDDPTVDPPYFRTHIICQNGTFVFCMKRLFRGL